MTNTSKNDEELRKHIRELMGLEVGISVEISGNLYIRELDNGDFAVGGIEGMHDEGFEIPKEGEPWPEWEDVVEGLDDAIDLFLKKRNEYRYGDDFWSVPNSE